MNELLVKIRFLLPSLPRAEKEFAQALLEQPKEVVKRTLAAAAAETGSSEASVIRFCKRMGFDGYSDLKRAIENAREEQENVPETISREDDMDTIIRKVFQSNVQTLQNTRVLANRGIEDAVRLLLQARSIHFFGVGDAWAACQFSYIKFSKLGIPCSLQSDVMLQYVTARNMKPGDVAGAVSYEGRSENIINVLKIARENGASTIGITRRNKSPMLKYIDIPLFISVSDLSMGWEKATRRVADQFILDILYEGFVAKSGKNYDEQLKEVQQAIDKNKL